MATSRVSDSDTSEASGQVFLLDDPEVLKEMVRRWLKEMLESKLSGYLGAGTHGQAGRKVLRLPGR